MAAVRILRSFRLFRLIKVLDKLGMRHLRQTVQVMLAVMMRIGPFALLFMLCMYIFSLLGVQLFGNRFVFRADTHQVRRRPTTNLHQPPAPYMFVRCS